MIASGQADFERHPHVVFIPGGVLFLTFKRDAGNTGDLTDVAATINTKGASADIDAMTLNGLAFFSNKGQSKAEFVLSGVNPANDDHFMTIRGQATFDKFKNLTKLTGTFVTEGTDTYTIDRKTGAQSGPVECFSSGTFVTGKPIPTP